MAIPAHREVSRPARRRIVAVGEAGAAHSPPPAAPSRATGPLTFRASSALAVSRAQYTSRELCPVGPLLCRLDNSAGRIEIAATGIDQLTQSVCPQPFLRQRPVGLGAHRHHLGVLIAPGGSGRIPASLAGTADREGGRSFDPQRSPEPGPEAAEPLGCLPPPIVGGCGWPPRVASAEAHRAVSWIMAPTAYGPRNRSPAAQRRR
jgi:hypothetical protein